MNQTRSLLLFAWLIVAAMLYMNWSSTPTASTPAATANVPQGNTAAPLPTTAGAPGAVPSAPAVPTDAPASNAPSTQTIQLRSDVLVLTVALDGGRIVDSELLQYPQEKTPGSPNVRLLTPDPLHYYEAQDGLLQVRGEQETPLQPQFRTSDGQREYVLAEGAAKLEVPLLWSDPVSGLSVRKTLVLERGRYAVGVHDLVGNAGRQAQRLYPYEQLQRVMPPAPPKRGGLANPDTFSFVGAAWYSPEDKFETRKFEKFAGDGPLDKEVTGGWIAMLQHHFLAAWVPAPGEKQKFSLAQDSRDGVPVYRIVGVGYPMDIAPGGQQAHESTLWVGPKLQSQLVTVAPSLKLSLDYGIFSFIAQPLFWLLAKLHALIGNWGWAIIAIVVLIKIVLYPLSAAQYRSFAKLRKVQPRIEALKERYGDDRQQFQMAMMELYKKEKINPVGGCLPLLIPIPIFFALYTVLRESVELRQAPWMGWVQNLTAADPYFILPALNLAVMYLTQKLTPSPGMDPMQKKMMQFMPLVFGVMMAFFPAGLVLYWVTNGVLGLLQQQYITRQHGEKPPAK